jgi:BMFP domain-containing protein YqiC
MSRREEIDKQLKKTYQTLLSTNDPVVQEQLEYLVKVLLREKESLTNPISEPVKSNKAQSSQAQSPKNKKMRGKK